MAFDKNNTSLGMKVIIVIFAVVLVLSLCLPFFSSCSNTAGTTSADDASTADSGTAATTVAGVQEQYASLVDSLTARLEDDPESLTYLANLGNTYMDMGVAMLSATDASDNEETVDETFSTAVSYYDDYLAAAEGDDAATADSVSAVTVDRTVCLFYAGEEDQAIEDLTAFLDETPDYTMGWYNLGSFYYQQGEYDLASEAYNKVVELDPDNESGALAYAQIYLSLIQSIQESAAESDEADAADDGTADTDAADDADTGDNATDDGTEADADGAADDADAGADDTASGAADGADADAASSGTSPDTGSED